MKKIVFLIISVFTLMSTINKLEANEDYLSEMNALENQVGQILGMMELKQEDNKKLREESERYTNTDELIKIAENNLKKEIDQLLLEYSAWEKSKKNYFAHNCLPGGSSTDKNLVDWCNEEAESLNRTSKYLAERKETLEFKKKTIKERREGLNKAVVENAQKQKSLNWEFVELQGKLRDLYTSMDSACKRLLADPKCKDEALKHKCGNIQFDNANPNLPALEDVGIKPGTQFFSR
jgi:hypothetical protein